MLVLLFTVPPSCVTSPDTTAGEQNVFESYTYEWMKSCIHDWKDVFNLPSCGLYSRGFLQYPSKPVSLILDFFFLLHGFKYVGLKNILYVGFHHGFVYLMNSSRSAIWFFALVYNTILLLISCLHVSYSSCSHTFTQCLLLSQGHWFYSDFGFLLPSHLGMWAPPGNDRVFVCVGPYRLACA